MLRIASSRSSRLASRQWSHQGGVAVSKRSAADRAKAAVRWHSNGALMHGSAGLPLQQLLDHVMFPRFESLLQSSSSSTILACSSAGVVVNEDRGSILQRLKKRLNRILTWLWEAFIVSTRSLEVSLRFSPLLVLSPAAMLSNRIFGDNAVLLSDVAWWYFRYTLQALGPAWQKLGQWAATRRDLFPVHVCDRLSTLHDHGFAHSWKHTHATLQQAFGADYAETLVVEDLIGCGSAAQVYKGHLREKHDNNFCTKRKVAIKVLHPRFASLVERDLVLIKSAANLLHSLPIEHIHVLNLPRVSENFSSILRNQSDLRVEADNLTKFRTNFYGSNDKNEASSMVFFPKPIRSTSQVLVEDLVDNARPISDYLKDATPEGWEIRKGLAGPLLRSFLKMVFIDSWVHCDLHPGNVMVRKTISEKSGKTKLSIVFLDAGIATSLSRNDQQNLIDLFRAVLLDDGYQAGKLMVERAKYERCSQVEGGVDAFSKGVAELVSEFHDRRKSTGLTLGAVHIGSLLSRVLDLCRVHGVEIDPSMASIVLSTLVLEGLGRSLHPDLNLIDFAIPFVLGRGRV